MSKNNRQEKHRQQPGKRGPREFGAGLGNEVSPTAISEPVSKFMLFRHSAEFGSTSGNSCWVQEVGQQEVLL
jgi:hypothetical protein